MQKQNESILENKDAVSKAEYEALSKQFDDLQINYKTLRGLFKCKKEKNGLLVNKYTKLEKELEGLQQEVKPKHNERGAGRKSTLTQEQLDKVQQLHEQRLSYGVIAKEIGLSKAYVYKLIKKQKVSIGEV